MQTIFKWIFNQFQSFLTQNLHLEKLIYQASACKKLWIKIKVERIATEVCFCCQEVGSIIGKKGDIVKRFREEVSFDCVKQSS